MHNKTLQEYEAVIERLLNATGAATRWILISNDVLIVSLEYEEVKNVSRGIKSKIIEITFKQVRTRDKELEEIKQTVSELRETFSKLKSTYAIGTRTCYNCDKTDYLQMKCWKRVISRNLRERSQQIGGDLDPGIAQSEKAHDVQ